MEEVEVDEEDDKDAEAEEAAEAQDEEADEAADVMAHQELGNPQDAAGPTAPTPTCKAAASASTVGSEIWGP
jgi:hypothetical protein